MKFVVADFPFACSNPSLKNVIGKSLEGGLILEVPERHARIPQSILDHASGRIPPITIRDITGRTCN